VLLGQKGILNSVEAVLNSRVTFNEFMALQDGVDQFVLTVSSVSQS
jgi:hypothetical protein